MRHETHDGPQFDAAGPVGRYWLAHGEGFEVVDASGRPLGVVTEVVAERDETVTKLVVRREGLRARRALLDPADLARVLPAERVFVARGISAEPRRRAPRAPVVRPAARRSLAATAAGARRGSAAAVVGAGAAAAAARRSSLAAGRGLRRADARLRPAVRAGAVHTRAGAAAGARTAIRFARAAVIRSRRAASAAAASLAAAYARARPVVVAAARSAALAVRHTAEAAAAAARRGAAAARPALAGAVRRFEALRAPLPPEPHDAGAADEPITRENAAAETPQRHAPRSRL